MYMKLPMKLGKILNNYILLTLFIINTISYMRNKLITLLLLLATISSVTFAQGLKKKFL